MSWIKVDSSQLHSLKYDPVNQELEAKFVCRGCSGSGAGAAGKSCLICGGNGHKGHYAYPEVPADVYVSVRDDKTSVGAAFHRLIKRGEHVSPAKPFTFRKIA